MTEGAGGVAVEAVDESGAERVAEAGEFGPALEQCAGEGGLALARGGMDGEAGGLVEDDQVVVLAEQAELDFDGLRGGLLAGADDDHFAGAEAVAGAFEGAVDADEAFVDLAAGFGAGGVLLAAGEEDVEAFAVAVGEEFGGDGDGGGHGRRPSSGRRRRSPKMRGDDECGRRRC